MIEPYPQVTRLAKDIRLCMGPSISVGTREAYSITLAAKIYQLANERDEALELLAKIVQESPDADMSESWAYEEAINQAKELLASYDEEQPTPTTTGGPVVEPEEEIPDGEEEPGTT